MRVSGRRQSSALPLHAHALELRRPCHSTRYEPLALPLSQTESLTLSSPYPNLVQILISLAHMYYASEQYVAAVKTLVEASALATHAPAYVANIVREIMQCPRCDIAHVSPSPSSYVVSSTFNSVRRPQPLPNSTSPSSTTLCSLRPWPKSRRQYSSSSQGSISLYPN